jgi:hypothetical protein
MLQSAGDIDLHPELVLTIKTTGGVWEPFSFLIDSGTETTTMPASEAKHEELPIPKRSVPG